jgi:hypothetical protein
MAERLLYLPAYGLIACLVLTVHWIREQTRMRAFGPAIFILAMLGLSIRTFRNPYVGFGVAARFGGLRGLGYGRRPIEVECERFR